MTAVVIDLHARARRALINAAVWHAADSEPRTVEFDQERLARLVECLGDVAAAFNRGHDSLDDELIQLAGVAAAWIDAESARPAA